MEFRCNLNTEKNKIAQFSSIKYHAISRWKFHKIADGTIGGKAGFRDQGGRLRPL